MSTTTSMPRARRRRRRPRLTGCAMRCSPTRRRSKDQVSSVRSTHRPISRTFHRSLRLSYILVWYTVVHTCKDTVVVCMVHNPLGRFCGAGAPLQLDGSSGPYVHLPSARGYRVSWVYGRRRGHIEVRRRETQLRVRGEEEGGGRSSCLGSPKCSEPLLEAPRPVERSPSSPSRSPSRPPSQPPRASLAFATSLAASSAASFATSLWISSGSFASWSSRRVRRVSCASNSAAVTSGLTYACGSSMVLASWGRRRSHSLSMSAASVTVKNPARVPCRVPEVDSRILLAAGPAVPAAVPGPRAMNNAPDRDCDWVGCGRWQRRERGIRVCGGNSCEYTR
ncbi:hypothetical protein K466DRAFT_227075 [Polyporus arcularius HHB13444]|uniref:Uncharacterized protein n=1 Tax=Polyporus arcularius HHB13444 TaxID=1314778 RepID=A0A5C3P750_9APHY|nr:hypothetical protein K466DRAFT_227075 [Polyporus arcularius HHB13444]